MKQIVIENPVLNPPYDEPTRHFYFTDDGISDKVVESRRVSSYFVPVPRPKKRGKQLILDTEWTQDRQKENHFINRVRERVDEKQFRKTMESFEELWKAMNIEEQSRLLRQLIDKVGYDGRTGKVTVSFKSASIKELCQK